MEWPCVQLAAAWGMTHALMPLTAPMWETMQVSGDGVHACSNAAFGQFVELRSQSGMISTVLLQ